MSESKSSGNAHPELKRAHSKTELEENAQFMDLYSRQIGAYGIETMSKVLQHHGGY